MPHDPNHPPEDDFDLPPRLLADLSALNRTPATPPSVDRAIMSHARGYFARQRRVRLGVRWVGAAAAILALAFGVQLIRRGLHSQMAEAPQAAMPSMPASRAFDSLATQSMNSASIAEDVNHDGKVDILDAFAVARGVHVGQSQPLWDVNHDGVIDQRDIDQIAFRAVAVKAGAQ